MRDDRVTAGVPDAGDWPVSAASVARCYGALWLTRCRVEARWAELGREKPRCAQRPEMMRCLVEDCDGRRKMGEQEASRNFDVPLGPHFGPSFHLKLAPET